MIRTIRAALMTAVVATLLAVPRPAVAHPSPFSYLDVVFRNGGIEGTLVVHVIDAAHELGIMPAERLLENDVAERTREQLGALLKPRLQLRGDDRRLELQWTSLEVLRDDAALRLRYRISNENPGALALDANLFPYDPLHQTFINVYEDGALKQQLIFNADSNEYVYYAGTTQGALAVMRTFTASGVHHILIGPDHILFLVGLLLLGGSVMQLLKIVTSFTIAHSITLTLAALGLVSPSSRIIEPAIALSIVYVGIDNLLVRPGSRDTRVWIALTFGLIHGFGFASVLREMDLPRRALGWSLFSFNLGVEIGQVCIVILVASMLAWIAARSVLVRTRIAYAGSVVVAAAGVVWFVQRVFFTAGGA